MKIVGVIWANLEESPLGTDGRLSGDLCGEAALTRTLRRITAAESIDEVILVCPSNQHQTINALNPSPQIKIRKFDGPDFPARQTATRARKWSLGSWRGGLGNSCFFDEHAHPGLCLAVTEGLQADGVIVLPAEAPLLAPDLIDEMVEHFREVGVEAKIVFAQAPPGLAPAIISHAAIAQLAQAGLSPGWMNSYRPNQPQVDMVTLPGCYRPALVVQQAYGRLCTDTDRGVYWLNRLLADCGEAAGAAEICEALSGMQQTSTEPFPREVEIELTTADQLGETKMRPRGSMVPKRGPLDLGLARALIDELAQYDDALVVLGGFGEPLLYPDFSELIDHCKQAGVFGVAVRTNGIQLDPDTCRHLIECDVDVVQVTLDANDAASYRAVHDHDAWSDVVQNIANFNELRSSMAKAFPIVVPSLSKSKDTFDSMLSFYDHWMSICGAAVIDGYSHHAGLVMDRRVLNMAPPLRVPCRQISRRCVVLSDGHVVACDQDFKGLGTIGALDQTSLEGCWGSESHAKLCTAHRQQAYDLHPMCSNCEEWHRP